MKRLVVLFTSLVAVTVHAGPKEDFIDAVVKHCGKSKDQAESVATGGRDGNVVKYKLCSSASIQIDGCTLPCADASSKIGG